MNGCRLCLSLLFAVSPLFTLHAGEEADQRGIREVLNRQQADWNRGDIRAFMTGYEHSEHLVFTSDGNINRGWQAALDRYLKAYPDRDAMGMLAFSGIEITLLGPAAAVILGRWELTRKSDRPHGVFSLILRKQGGAWKIIHDHTSRAR